MKTHYGINQVPGGSCPDTFHYCYPDYEAAHIYPYPDMPAVDSTCPTCGAVRFPGGAVTKEFAAEYERRLANDICLTSRVGKFLCSRKVPAKTRATGSCICKVCENREARREGRADGIAYSRTVERDHR